MQKVYKFSPKYKWSWGVILVNADSEEKATDLAKDTMDYENEWDYGEFSFDGVVDGLSYEYPNSVIVAVHHVE